MRPPLKIGSAILAVALCIPTGLLAQGTYGENWMWAAGVTNGFNNTIDGGDNKGALGRNGYSEGNLSVLLNAFIGSEQTRTSLTDTNPVTTTAIVGNDSDGMQIYDLVVNYAASDDLDLWLNYDYGTEDYSRDVAGGITSAPKDARWYGVSAGFAYDISEKTSISVRGEWFRDDGGTRLLAPCAAIGGARPPCAPLAPLAGEPPLGDQIDMTSATLTIAHKLTDNLMARLEYRHDTIEGNGSDDTQGHTFPKHGGDFDKQLDMAVVEISYTFD